MKKKNLKKGLSEIESLNCRECGNELKPYEHEFCHNQVCMVNRMANQFESKPKKKTRKEKTKKR